MDFFVQILEGLEDLERKWLDNTKKYSIHLARLVSLGSIMLVTYLFTLLFSIIIGYMIDNYYSSGSAEFEYVWAIALLIASPLTLPVFTNWMDRDYCYSSIIVDIFETAILIMNCFHPLKSYFEIIGFLIYISASMVFTLFAIANFVDEQTLVSYIEAHNYSFFSVIGAIHIVIYILIRILLLPNKTLEQRYRKSVREFILWLLVLVIGIGYMIYKLLSLFSTIDMFYLIGAILVAFVRFMTSYKELRKVIIELKETASFFV